MSAWVCGCICTSTARILVVTVWGAKFSVWWRPGEKAAVLSVQVCGSGDNCKHLKGNQNVCVITQFDGTFTLIKNNWYSIGFGNTSSVFIWSWINTKTCSITHHSMWFLWFLWLRSTRQPEEAKVCWLFFLRRSRLQTKQAMILQSLPLVPAPVSLDSDWIRVWSVALYCYCQVRLVFVVQLNGHCGGSLSHQHWDEGGLRSCSQKKSLSVHCSHLSLCHFILLWSCAVLLLLLLLLLPLASTSSWKLSIIPPSS